MPKKKMRQKTEEGHVELCKWATTYKQLYRTHIVYMGMYGYVYGYVCVCVSKLS